MGLDLTLVYCRHSDSIDWWLGYCRMGLDRNYDLFCQFAKTGREEIGSPPQVCHPQKLPDNIRFEWYGDEGIKTYKTDPYGQPLTYVLAGEVAKIDASRTSAWNKAIIEHAKALPPKTPIVLWWH